MHSSYTHIQMKYKSSLELKLQTFVILDIHPHKNPTIELEFFFLSLAIWQLQCQTTLLHPYILGIKISLQSRNISIGSISKDIHINR